MKRGFTLIELLVIVSIIAVMVGVGVGTIAAGKGAARVKGATRDIYAAIRNARSRALVTGQRVVLTYSNARVEDEAAARVEIVSAQIMNGASSRADVQRYDVKNYEDLPSVRRQAESSRVRRAPASKADAAPSDEGGGRTVEDILFAPIHDEVVRGMRLKAVKGDDEESDETAEQKSHRISVSSNVDWLLGLYKGLRSGPVGEDSSKGASSATAENAAGQDDMTGEVSVVWETNGAVEPHRVWVYADGKKPENGLLIRVDRFGGVKVLSGDGREER